MGIRTGVIRIGRDWVSVGTYCVTTVQFEVVWVFYFEDFTSGLAPI